MASYYYSGQGSLYVGVRNAQGRPTGLVRVGNVPSLELSIDVEKLEHKESETGNRAVDVTIVQEQNATFSMVVEDFKAENLALAFFGTSSRVAGAAVVDEAVTLYAVDADGEPVKTPLAHNNLNSAVAPNLTDSLAAVMTRGVDYEIDFEQGTIWALAGWTGAALPNTGALDYTHKGYHKLAAFTQTSIERFLRFEGINTVDGKVVTVDLFRAQFDPAQNFPLINDEIAQMTLSGNILQDSLNSAQGSDFFIQRQAIDVA